MSCQGSANRKKQANRWVKLKRWFKYKYLLLLRAKGGPAMVAKGFSIGLFVEMFTLPTFGLAAVLILPLVYFLRASLPAALIGFLFGKLIYIPVAVLNKQVGSMIVPRSLMHHIHFHPHWLERLIKSAMDLIVGGMIVGALLGVVCYFPVRMLLQYYAQRRKEKRKRRKDQRMLQDNTRA